MYNKFRFFDDVLLKRVFGIVDIHNAILRLALRIFTIIGIVLIFSSISYSYIELYPTEITDSIVNLKNDFSNANLESTYKVFLKNKGIYDDTLAYTILSIAESNKDKVDKNSAFLISKFYPKDRERFEVLMNGSLSDYILHIGSFVTNFSIYSFLRNLSKIFILILFISYGIKNYYILMHTHSSDKNIVYIKMVLLGLFLLLPLFYLTNFIYALIGSLTIIFILPEKILNRVITFVFILLFLVINSVDFHINGLKDNSSVNSAALKPASKEYLMLMSKDNKDSFKYRLISAIKYNTELQKNDLNKMPADTFEAGNIAVLNLINNNIERFNSIIERYSLGTNNSIKLNLAVYYARHFQYDKYNELITELHKYDPELIKVFQNYQLNFNSNSYMPFFISNDGDGEIIFNYIYFLVNFIILLIVFIGISLARNFNVKRCISCGESFCFSCEPLVDSVESCSICRHLNDRSVSVEPAELVKQTIKIDKFRLNRSNLMKLSAFILPSAEKIFSGKILSGIFAAFLFSLLSYLLIFGYSPYFSASNIGFHKPISIVFIILIAVSMIFYVVNILLVLRKK